MSFCLLMGYTRVDYVLVTMWPPAERISLLQILGTTNHIRKCKKKKKIRSVSNNSH